MLIWRGRKHNTIKKTQYLVVASEEIGLEANAEKYIFYKCGTVKIFWKTLKNQNSIHEETKGRLKSGKTCPSVQNLLSSSLLT